MSESKPITRRTWLAIAAGLVIGVRPPRADAEGDHNQRRIAIAVPDFTGSSGDDAIARDITQLLTTDLKTSDRLVLVESDGLAAGDIDAIPHFDKLRAIHADCLVTGNAARAPDRRVKVQFRLWDISSGRQMIGAQYMLLSEDWHQASHAMSAGILERLTE